MSALKRKLVATPSETLEQDKSRYEYYLVKTLSIAKDITSLPWLSFGHFEHIS